ncbi:hypothetical protein [Consotaella aegiceratis]|uniref:hypothetical protein n=1 Tax=Consotaella aegiceratis TaxID=3097961 RepID=UPI002F3F3F62
MIGKTTLDIGNPRKGPIPSQLQFSCHQSVLRVDGVILAEGAIGGAASRLELAHRGIAHLIAAVCRLCLGFNRRGRGSRLDHLQERCALDGIADAQAAEDDTTRLAVIEEATPGIARMSCLAPM